VEERRSIRGAGKRREEETEQRVGREER